MNHSVSDSNEVERSRQACDGHEQASECRLVTVEPSRFVNDNGATGIAQLKMPAGKSDAVNLP